MVKLSNSKFAKNVISAIAAYLFGASIGLCVSSGVGVDPLSVLISGLSSLTGIGFSMMNFILNIVLVVIAALMSRKHIGIITFVSIPTVSLGIQTVTILYNSIAAVPSYLVFAVGLIGSAATIAWMIVLDCGKSPYDAFVLTIADTFHSTYHVIRWVTDLSSILIGWLLKGSFGVGTVICLLASGKLVEWFIKMYSCRGDNEHTRE